MRKRAWIAVLFAPTAWASDGWVCTATGTWALCDDAGHCTSQAVEAQQARPNEADAHEAAVMSCRQEVGVERVRRAFLTAPDEPAGQISRIEADCAVTECTEQSVDIDPNADAFDEPVCIAVRQYICSLCGDTSPLCVKVQSEQPVTADACSETHARLSTFSDLLGQVDSLQPGTWTDARRELCGMPTP